MLRVLDLNNFWSPTGGGVRRYHLQKLEYFKTREDIHYVFLMQDSETRTEVINETTLIEHVEAWKVPGNWEYRFLKDWRKVLEYILKVRPDVIEVGSPYVMPGLVKKAIDHLPDGFIAPRVVGFWHADFPVTYIYRFFRKFTEPVGKLFGAMGWAFARRQYNWMDGIYVSSEVIKERMLSHKMKKTFFVPLGVDAEHFHPSKRSKVIEAKLLEMDSSSSRRSIFYPHRFSQEKGVRDLVASYKSLKDEFPNLPRLIFAGTGPDLEMVEELIADNGLCRYLGFIKSKDEMAEWYATCELGLALSGWETFGLSILEAMASGQVLIGANSGAASEHITKSNAGYMVPTDDVPALIDAIKKLAELDDETLAKWSQKSRAYAEKLTWNHCFDLEVKYYLEVYENNKGQRLDVTLSAPIYSDDLFIKKEVSHQDESNTNDLNIDESKSTGEQ